MVRRGSGLIVEMTDGDSGRYRGTLTPDFLRSEAVLEHFGVSEDNWRAGAAKDPHFAQSESPRFVGRAVAALTAVDHAASFGPSEQKGVWQCTPE